MPWYNEKRNSHITGHEGRVFYLLSLKTEVWKYLMNFSLCYES